MNPYTAYDLAKIRQHELLAEADHARLVKAARLASRGTGAPARRPLIWLREVAGDLGARVMTLAGAHAGSH